MTTRDAVLSELRAALPKSWKVGGSELGSAPVNGPTVAVWQTSVKRTDRLRLALDIEFSVWVLTGKEKPELADAELDESLAAVLNAVEHIKGLTWTVANRAVLQENNAHGYQLSLTALG